MTNVASSPVKVLIVAVPETAGSALYGMIDVLCAAGNIWQTLVRKESLQTMFDVQIVSLARKVFTCGNRIPVNPDVAIKDNPSADIVILPELWLGPDENIKNRYPKLIDWLRRKYKEGSILYSACSGTIMLAETGLLNGCEATSHWGYQDLFQNQYPQVHFNPEPNLVFSDSAGKIVTAGGTTSWHDLALHIIARHGSTGEALRIAKVYLLKWHDEGQLPYAALIRKNPHNDSAVKTCEKWLMEHYCETDIINQVIEQVQLSERTLKRRFKKATNLSLIEYIQNLRIEEAKRLLESTQFPVDEISVAVSYEDPSFFRRLFKRLTGLNPSQYRRMFQPITNAQSKSPNTLQY